MAIYNDQIMDITLMFNGNSITGMSELKTRLSEWTGDEIESLLPWRKTSPLTGDVGETPMDLYYSGVDGNHNVVSTWDRCGTLTIPGSNSDTSKWWVQGTSPELENEPAEIMGHVVILQQPIGA